MGITNLANIDVVIVALFLIANLIVGLFHSRGSTTLREYAVGNKNFSTSTISATVIATCIGGGFFSSAITETYKQGLYFIIPALGEPLCLIIIGYFFVPRMGEFLGDLSIADALGKLFGKYVQIIVAIAGVFLCIGIVALQFKVGAAILRVFFGISGFYAILICAVVVTTYSAFGGIKAVTFTDILQFFTFGAIIPIISLAIWGALDEPQASFEFIKQNPLFNFKQVFDFSNPKFLNTIFLLAFFLLPGFQPVFFQRIIIAKNTRQGKNAFMIGGFVCLIMLLTISWIGVLLLSSNPNLDADNLLPYIISTYNYTGLKGFTAVGIMAVIMSTADSYISSSAVLFANDILKPLNLQKLKLLNDVTLLYIFSFFVGIIGFFLAFKASTVLNLLLLIFSFYMPIVSVPLILAILGFRSSSKSVLIGMFSGFVTVIIFNYLDIGIDSLIPGVIVHAMFLIGSHYLLNQPGGWVGIKDPEQLNLIKLERKNKLKSIIRAISNFNFITFCKNNSPRQEHIYSFFGLFCIISVFSTIYSMPKEIQKQNSQMIEYVYHTVLLSSSIFLTYPIWPKALKKENFIVIAWNIAVPYILVFSQVLLVIISNFGQFQLMILMLNMLVIAILLRWQVAIFMIFISVIASIEVYKLFPSANNFTVNLGTLQFKIMYLLLLVSSVLIAFLKPKQDYLEETEHKVEVLETEVTHLYHEVTDLSGKITGLNTQVTGLSETVDHYSQRVSDQENEIERLGTTAQKILNNVNHELRLPIGNVINFADMLNDALEKSDNHLVKELSKEVYNSSNRVSSMILNMLDLAMLDVKKVELQKKTINFSELVEYRVKTCRRIYLGNKKIDFELSITSEILIAVDANYIRQTVDNLVINAINFSQTGLIKIVVTKDKNMVIFTIIDQGVGIPPVELTDIFTPFKMGSNTESKACGRGVGLALCKSAVEAHGGTIKATSDGKVGVTLRFCLPL